MGMTITEKILARRAGLHEVHAGQIINAKIDLAMTQDASAPIAFSEFRELNIPVWDKSKVFVCIDHFAPATTLQQVENLKISEDFARDYGIEHFFNIRGISHQLICEGGYVRPGMVAVGADSHTTTYGALGAFSTGIGSTEMCSVLATGELWFRVPEAIKVTVTGKLPEHVYSKDIILKLLSMIQANGATYKTLEFCGDTITDLSVEARFTLCNMSVEGGAKNAIIAPDDKTVAYLEARGIKRGDMEIFESDSDANYVQEIVIDASQLTPMVAKPHSPANGVSVAEVEGTPLHQVIIGSCTNGRTEDFKIAAEIMRGRKVPRDIKCFNSRLQPGYKGAC